MKHTSALLVGIALSLSAVSVGAVTLQGKVTDASGSPLRGVLVKATMANRSVSRFTDAQGNYRIADLPNSAMTVSTMSFGYADQSLSVKAGATTANIKLESKADRSQLSSAEVLTLLPENDEVRWLKARCITCHGMTQLERLRGAPEEGWKAILSAMVMNYGRDDLNEAEKAYAAKLAAKYFGPTAAQPDLKKVRRAALSDVALTATFYEMELPTARAFPHSIVADNKGSAWIAEFGANGNRLAKWNFARQTIEEFPLRGTNTGPHTPTVGADGRIWTALLYGKQVTVLDPATNKIDYIPLDMELAHTLSTDAQGNIWGNGTKVYRVDPRTRKITYWIPMKYPEPPKGSWLELGRLPGLPPPKNLELYAYHTVVDSKGMVWYTALETGWLVRLDPKSGEQKAFKSPGVNASRGLAVDSHDNIWYTNWGGHGVARLDQRTEKIDLFKLPTEYAMPYSVFEDKRRGFIWLADYNGNNLTRLDPKTGVFVEYPMPSRESYPRFISIDNEGRVWFAEWWNSKVGLLDPYAAERTALSAR